MKICIVGFDIWGFNKLIVEELKKKDIETTFIDTSKIKFRYKNIFEKIYNFFSKNFFNYNLKRKYITKVLIDTAKKLSPQDFILIINPCQINQEVFHQLRNKTENLIAFNYDSLARMPIPKEYINKIDRIFSFDLQDVKENSNIELLTNFNYLSFEKNNKISNKAFIIISNSQERELFLNKIADRFDELNFKNYEFIVYKPALKNRNSNIKKITDRISLEQMLDKMTEAEILIDLVRENQTGLSFRIFEAMALRKKIITNNASIKEYDFYNPTNILVIDEHVEIPLSFFESKYQDIPNEIYEKYTITQWIKNVFGI